MTLLALIPLLPKQFSFGFVEIAAFGGAAGAAGRVLGIVSAAPGRADTFWVDDQPRPTPADIPRSVVYQEHQVEKHDGTQA